MGRHASRFIKLSGDDLVWLEDRWRGDASHATRCRAHAILLSHQRYNMVQISQILHVSYETIEAWFDRWERQRRDGLTDAARSGRPPTLDDQDREVLREIAVEHPQQPGVMPRWTTGRGDQQVART